MQSKNALSNLKNRYATVLKKCALINFFGTLAFATMLTSPFMATNAQAADNPAGTTINSMNATPFDQGIPGSALNTSILNNYGNIIGGAIYNVAGAPHTVGMFGYNFVPTEYVFNNTGTININSTEEDLYGMSATTSVGDHNLTNSGTINVMSSKTSVYGMYTHTLIEGNHTLINSGSIDVSGTHRVFGMYTFSQGGNQSFANSGSIKASGTGDFVYGMHAGTNVGDHNLTNSGTIDVSGNNGVSGMYIRGTNVNNGIHLLNNTGSITATATATGGTAFEAYGENDYTVGTWATTLRTWTPTASVFGGNLGVSVNLANSTLVFRPGEEADGFQFGTEYDLTNLVSIGGTPTATQFGKVTTEVPFLKAVVAGGNSTDTATVRLDTNINAETTPGSATAQGNLAVVQGQMSNITRKLLQTKYNEIYADLVSDNGNSGNSGIAAGSDMEQNKWIAFLTPYGSLTNNNEYNFDGSQTGVTGGASYNFSEKFSLGAHFDFNYAEFDADLMDMESSSTSFAFGLHANYNIMPQWYVSAQATGSISQIENEYSLPTGIAESKADYDSQAIYLALNSGYVFEVAKGHTFTPQIGFSYLNMHSDSYDIDWASAYSMYDMEYDSTSYSAFYADLTLNWRSAWQFENNNALALMASVGVRQNLSGSDIDSDFRFLGTEYSTRSSADDTTFLADLGLEWMHGNFSLSLNYNGEYGNEQQVHGGAIEFKYMF